MCEVTTALMVGGALMSAYGTYSQMSAQKSQAKYQAAVGRNNAVLAERAAKDAEERGRLEVYQKRLQTGQVIGAQRSALAASNLVIDDDSSALAILQDTSRAGELDALTIKSNADRTASNYRQQGAQFSADANASNLAAKSINPVFGAGATLLSGAAKAYGRYSDLTPTTDVWGNPYGSAWQDPDM